MNRKLKYIATFIAIIFSVSGEAQKYWTLEECINYALQNNIRIKQAEQQAFNQEALLKQGEFQRVPSLNFSSNNTFNYGRNVDPFTNTFVTQGIRSSNFQLSGSVNLFNGFQITNNIKQLHKDRDAAKLDQQSTTNDVMLTVCNYYLQTLLATEILSTAKSQYELTTIQLERTRKLFDAGRLSEGDVLQQEAQLANDEYSKVTAQNNLASAYLNLWQSLDLPNDSNSKILPPKNISPSSLINATPDDIYNYAVASRAEILAAENRTYSTAYMLKTAEGGRLPRLALFGNLSSLYSSSRKDITGINITGVEPSGIVGKTLDTVYSPKYNYNTQTPSFGKQLNDNYGRNFGISLQIPILNGWQVNTSVQRAKINYTNAKLNLDLAKQNLYKSITQACFDLNAAKAKYESAVNSKKAQQKSYEFIKIKYENGASTYNDLMIATTNKIKSETTYLQSKYEYIFREKIIDFYLGKKIAL